MEKPHYLSTRPNWQLQANKGGAKSETDVYCTLKANLDPEEYDVVNKPKWFDTPFLEYQHSLEPMIKPEDPEIDDEWYDDGEFYRMTEKGAKKINETFIPDIGIIHLASNRKYIIEVKKQQAAGNAHERACKYMAPGMVDYLKESLEVDYHPVGFVFSGGMADNAGYRREVSFFIGKSLRHHVLFWKGERDPNHLAEWFDSTVRPLLCQ